MWKNAVLSVLLILFGAGVAFFVFKSEPRLNPNFESEKSFFKNHPFRLGLDLSGGTHLVYQADVSGVAEGETQEAMEALRNVVERRVNVFGVSEPLVQVQRAGLVSGSSEQLIVDLPGVTDVEQAIEMIGKTPVLEFKTLGTSEPIEVKPNPDGSIDLSTIDLSQRFIDTGLTGRYLERATLEFDPTTREPLVTIKFNEEGTKLFEKITKENVGKPIAIYLDGEMISAPIVDTRLEGTGIATGEAFIEGDFNPAEAREMVRNLNLGALPVPITLLSTQTIGGILGESAIAAGVRATVIGFLLVAVLLMLWYRLPGVIAVVSLSLFVIIMLALFKLIPVTLTAAGVAGFIISIGVAVDANVLVFERMKEEIRAGGKISGAATAGFSRAWDSIRDSNISGIIIAIILYWFGTSLIKGFALTLGIGILASLFCAVFVMQVLLRALSFAGEGKMARFLFGSGITK